MKNMTQNKALMGAVEKWGLDMPEHYFEIVDYELVNNEIVIKKVKALDRKGNFIRFAKLDKLVDVIHKYPIKFKSEDDD